MIKRIICTLFMTYVLVGSIGVQIFIHSCHSDGISKSIVVKPTHECEAHHDRHHAKQFVESCCHTQIDEGCCSDETKAFQVQFDYFDEEPEAAFILPITIVPVVVENPRIILASSNLKLSVRPPPKPKGKDLLIAHQVFRI